MIIIKGASCLGQDDPLECLVQVTQGPRDVLAERYIFLRTGEAQRIQVQVATPIRHEGRPTAVRIES